MIPIKEKRQFEHAKYDECYEKETYRMGQSRKAKAFNALHALDRGVYLDVGCGRGEMVDLATTMGFDAVGIEVVSALIDPPRIVYGEAHDIPYGDFSTDVVSLFDVMEHLLPEDTHQVLDEMERVAQSRGVLLLSIPSWSMRRGGIELHINLKSQEEWSELFDRRFPKAFITVGESGLRDAGLWTIYLGGR